MEIVLRSVNDDWEELLIDGKRMLEGHSLSTSEVIKAVMPQDAVFTETHIARCIYCEERLPDNVRKFQCLPQCKHD
jgi:hypothetical protein